jgi:hypothetical protein
MYSHSFKCSLEYFKTNLPKNTTDFLLGCGFTDQGLEKVYITALNNLLHKKEKPIIEPRESNILKLLLLILTSFLYSMSISIITIVFNNLLFRKGSYNGPVVDETKKYLFWSDMSLSSLNPFFFLKDHFPSSYLTVCVSQKHIFTKRDKSNHYFFYTHTNIKSVLNSAIFLFVHLPSIIRIIGTNYSIISQIRFCIEFLKAISVNEKISLIIKKNIFLKEQISIFPHDNSPFYSTMIDLFNQNNIPTVVIIHGGCYFENNIILVPSHAKYVITSSIRETLFYREVYNLKSFSFGIPLQLFVKKKIFIDDLNIEKKYDILILGSYGPYWENLIRLRYITVVAMRGRKVKILLRHHPSADKKSIVSLESLLKDTDYVVSKNTRLESDISLSNIVISFSVDSNIICLLNKKQTIYCAFPDAKIPSRLLKWENLLYIVSSEAEMLETLNKLIDKPTEDISPNYYREFIREFGEFDEHKILKNIKAALNEIQLLESA